MLHRCFIAAAALALIPAVGSAQTVRGVVVDDGDRPVPGVVVLLLDAASRTAARALSDERGDFRVAAPGAGAYRLSTLRIGFRPAVSESFTLGTGEVVERRLVVGAVPVALAAVRVAARSACRALGGRAGAAGARAAAEEAAATLAVWEQARAALDAADLTAAGAASDQAVADSAAGDSARAPAATSRVLAATAVVFERALEPISERVLAQRSAVRSALVTAPWLELPPERLRRVGYVVVARDGSTTYYAPGLAVLTSDAFLEDHCFHLTSTPTGGGAPDDAQGRLVGIAFEPAPGRRRPRGAAGIRGTLWLDRATAELRRLEFRYAGAPRELEGHAGGAMEFARLRDGGWAITRWSIRMPELEYRVRSQRFGGSDLRLVSLRESGGELAFAARGLDTLYAREPLTLAGVVRDSLSGEPLPGAWVTLAGTALGATANHDGRFAVRGVLPGVYLAEVRTASLDSAGAAHAVPLAITDDTTSVELRVPTATQIVRSFCGRRPLDAPGILVGTVSVRGESAPPAGVTVVAEWREPRERSEGGGVVAEEQSRWLQAKADSVGDFRLCGVPVNTALTLRAERGGAGTDPVAVRIRADARLARAELVLEPSRSRGAVLAGVVLAESTMRPVVEAEVSIPELLKSAYTDERGAFRLTGIPPGTHTVLVRRLGYGPLDTAFAFGPNQMVDRRIHLTRVVTLDSVSVVAERVVIPSFEEHRKIGLGHFITREELAKQEERRLADILREIPAVGVRSATGNRAWIESRRGVKSLTPRCRFLEDMEARNPQCGCFAEVYLDGVLLRPTEVPNINRFPPDQIEAVEYYAGPSQTPARYAGLESPCGVLVIWRRRSP